MENRITILNIIISDLDAAGRVNELLHQYARFIIGRLGIPYGDKGVSIISVVMDIPGAEASALSGKLGMLSGVTSKVMTAKV